MLWGRGWAVGRGVAVAGLRRSWRRGGAGCVCASFRAVLRRHGGQCPCCSGRRCGFVKFLDKVVVLPVVVQRADKVADVPVVQVLGAVPAVMDVLVIKQRQVGVSPTVKVPQIQFIVPSEDMPVVQQRRVQRSAPGLPFVADMAAMKGFLFSRSSRLFGVERQFSEPSMVKSSLPSGAPLPISCSELVDINTLSEGSRRKQQQ